MTTLPPLRLTAHETNLIDLLLKACAYHCRDYASFLGIVANAAPLSPHPTPADIRRAYILMLALDLLHETDHNNHFHITEKGLHAAQAGIETYLKNRETQQRALRQERNLTIATALREDHRGEEMLKINRKNLLLQTLTLLTAFFTILGIGKGVDYLWRTLF